MGRFESSFLDRIKNGDLFGYFFCGLHVKQTGDDNLCLADVPSFRNFVLSIRPAANAKAGRGR